MATPATPTNFTLSQGNRQVYLQWDLQAGATSYIVQRSTDGNTYSTVSTSASNSYLDTAVTAGNQYWYRVTAVGTSGSSQVTTPQSIIPTPNGEMSLAELRLRSQQRSDRVGSSFISTTEWNSMINQSLLELYDLLVTAFEDYFMAPFAYFTTTSQTGQYALPDGATTFQDSSGANFTAQPLYKLLGVDLGLQSANNAFVSVRKFNWQDRNKYVYPNTASTIYGVFNLQYRMMGTNLQLIPAPSSGQPVRLSYIPRMPTLLRDIDYTVTGVSGWLEYVIVDVAIKALTKEESDTSALQAAKLILKQRIEEAAENRDAGQPDTITEVRGSSGNGSTGNGGWPSAGW